MKLLIIVVLVLILVVAMSGLIVGLYRTYKTQHSANQQKFLNGAVPTKPDGFYSGTITGLQSNWQGKEFTAAAQTGINRYNENGTELKRYPFKTSVTKGLRDKREVLRISYDLPDNPWWTRRVVDELVEVEPDHYLGKIHYQVWPGFSFALGYFQLKR